MKLDKGDQLIYTQKKIYFRICVKHKQNVKIEKIPSEEKEIITGLIKNIISHSSDRRVLRQQG